MRTVKDLMAFLGQQDQEAEVKVWGSIKDDGTGLISVKDSEFYNQ